VARKYRRGSGIHEVVVEIDDEREITLVARADERVNVLRCDGSPLDDHDVGVLPPP
jgi:hypothetical protein